MRQSVVLVAVLMAAVLLFTWTVPAQALGLGDALKVFGIGYAVKHFGPQINSFINSILAQRGIAWEGTTKVVPIVSVGRGGYIGAAQVAGPPDLVAQVKAVAQGELKIGSFQGNALFPISTTDAKNGIKKVEGVGLSALIDFKM